MIYPTISLSKRKHLPVWYIVGRSFKLWDLRSLIENMQLMRTFELQYRKEGYFTARVFGKSVKLTETHAKFLITELPLWREYYLPPFSLEDLTVLDIGAGCGETALFYLEKGAKKVIAIEPDAQAFNHLQENVAGLNVVPINDNFKLDYLTGLDFNLMKMDCEGCEALLLDSSVKQLPDSIIEAHNPKLQSELKRKFGTLRTAYGSANDNIVLLTSW